jgi:hypothetical protein
MCSMIGRFATGTIGFGRLIVSGFRRVPKPPAMITPFIRDSVVVVWMRAAPEQPTMSNRMPLKVADTVAEPAGANATA